VDIDPAITHHGVAVRGTQGDHPSKADHLNNLGNSFATHFERLGEVADIDRAICNPGDAVQRTPDDRPENTALLVEKSQNNTSLLSDVQTVQRRTLVTRQL
jgi:hypothetical protein